MRYFFLLLVIMVTCGVSAQRDTLGRYSPGFKFRDGLYLGFDDFKANCPSVPLDKVRDEEGNVIKRLAEGQAWYQSIEDSLAIVPADSVWGFSQDGKIFVRHQEYFDRLVVIGALSHIIHREEYIDYGGGIYDGFGYAPTRRMIETEYVIDLASGEKTLFNESTLGDLLKNDPVMHNGYSGMNKKKRKESMFRYLHSYNDAHPVYFPISRCR